VTSGLELATQLEDLMDTATPTPPRVDPPLLNRSQVAEQLNISVRQLDRLIACDEFPEPLRIGRRSPRWRFSDVQAYIARLAS
jgi:predicted DNA-binding transcriptional regulator AlpA